MTLYLDTSSLVKLYVEEVGTDAVAALARNATMIVTSTVAYAETRAAFARRRRERTIAAADATRFVAKLDADWATFLTIDVTDALAQRAGALADRFNLLGFDAVHLASLELVIERADDDDVRFSSADDALSKAARKLG